jgi:NAD-dependent deacetylase
LKNSERVFFITGAGLSADSNIPTYRGIGGLYNDDETEEGISIEEALSGEMMYTRPEISWRHIARIVRACRGATFNRGHQVIAEMESHFDEIWILTQNVDGFHYDAGSSNVIDIHGNTKELFCMKCQHKTNLLDLDTITLPPKCHKCDGILRPDVVLFGEMLPLKKLALLSEITEEPFDIVFSVGTSSLFPYIMQPVFVAKMQGIPTVEINPEQTTVSSIVDIKLAAKAAESLDAIWSNFLKTAH